MESSKKRKTDASESEENVSSFSLVHMGAMKFREHLREEDNFTYIKDYFLNNKNEDKVSDYIKAGGSVSEIAGALTKLDLRRREKTEVIFSALHLIVIKSIKESSDLPQFQDECKQFISSYIGELQSVLSSKTILKHKITVLKLLASIAVVSTHLASQILSSLSLSKEDLEVLTPHVDPMDDQSLRVSFIHFILSFIIDQSPKVIEKLLAKKNWLPSIFWDLRYDLPFTVHLVLSTLEDKILNNGSISKTSKLFAFNGPSLYHLSQLYCWNPKAWFISRPKMTYTGSFDENEAVEIRHRVHQLLLKICTSSKLGIVFQDDMCGTSNTQKNYNLSNFLQKLEQPFDDNLKKELLYEMIVTSPQLLQPMLNFVSPLLKTSGSKWLEIIEFITKVLNNIQIKLSEKTSISIIQDLVVPKQLLDCIDKDNLSQKGVSQRLGTLRLISNMLNNYSEIYKGLKKYHTESAIESIMTPYLVHKLPSSGQLLECLKLSYTNKEKELIRELVDLFILYEKLCPTLIDIIRFDYTITTWIEGMTVVSTPEDELPLILDLIRLETIINPHYPYQDDFLNRLKWTTVAKDEEVKRIGLDIMKELFDKSGLFIRSPSELALWIYCIGNNLDPEIGPLMAHSLKWALENTNTVYKNLLDAQDQSTPEDVSDLNLDDFLKLSVNDDFSSVEEATISSILHLSPLLPSVLHIIASPEYKNINDDFLTSFIVHYFHRQVTVKPYETILKKYSCSSVEKVMPYIQSWFDQPKVLYMPCFKNSHFLKISKFILKEKLDPSEITKDLSSVKREQAELILEQCLFMACELSRLKKATSEKLNRIMCIVKHCLSHEEIQINLDHPTLLTDFHPLRNVGDSDLTQLVIAIVEHTELPPKSLAPFSHRLAFELKYARKMVYNLEDISTLMKLLKVFQFSENDVDDLIDYVFSLKNKYFVLNNELSPWAKVAEHLISLATSYKLVISEDKFDKLCKSITSLLKESLDVSQLCSELLNYLKNVFTDVSGVMIDSISDLFYSLCTATYWHESLCVHLLSYLDHVNYSDIPVERTVPLLASLESYDKKHSEVVADSSGIIYQGLCSRPTAKWVSDLKKIENVLPFETCKKICKRVKKHSKEIFTSVESLACVEMVFTKSEQVYDLYTLILTWLNEAIDLPANSFELLQCEEMCRILMKILESGIDLVPVPIAENDLVKSLLLNGLKEPSAPMLNLIQSIVKYKVGKLPPGEIFELLCSHSCFLDVLMSKSCAKYSAVTLMLELLTLDSTLINSSHVPVLLSSYNASLSKVDQTILKILQIYEKIGGVNLADWKPYVWGEAAVDHYSVKTKVTPKKPNPSVTLDLFEKETVFRTITRFPLNRGLDVDYDGEDAEVYDPAFYLPLLSQVFGGRIGGWKVAGSGVIGLTLAALASSQSELRAAAYHVLHRLYSSFPDHKDNAIWKNFIEALRGGIVDLEQGDNVRLSSIVTTFLARASIIMSTPDDPLYFILHNFIYAKPHLKLDTVPAFLEMFHSSQSSHRLHQWWVLEVLKDGLKEQRDLQIALNSLTFKFILDFHSCSLAIPKTKELIEALVGKCLQFIDQKQLLINNYSIIPWMSCADPKLISELPQHINPQYLPLIRSIKKTNLLKQAC